MVRDSPFSTVTMKKNPWNKFNKKYANPNKENIPPFSFLS